LLHREFANPANAHQPSRLCLICRQFKHTSLPSHQQQQLQPQQRRRRQCLRAAPVLLCGVFSNTSRSRQLGGAEGLPASAVQMLAQLSNLQHLRPGALEVYVGCNWLETHTTLMPSSLKELKSLRCTMPVGE
jgi:hypothetical protein